MNDRISFCDEHVTLAYRPAAQHPQNYEMLPLFSAGALSAPSNRDFPLLYVFSLLFCWSRTTNVEEVASGGPHAAAGDSGFAFSPPRLVTSASGDQPC
jgi:hypothetical protein